MNIKRSCFISKKKISIAGTMALLIIMCSLMVLIHNEPDELVLSYGIANKIIVVDAGHGGMDPGAARGDLKEKDITLEISQKLVRLLSQAGALVINLREGDTDLVEDDFKGKIRERKRKDLATRVQVANEAKADLFISVHANADPSPQWSGSQTFYYGKSEESKILAKSIQAELTSIMGNTKRQAKTGVYYIMEHTNMPTVIVEVGFLSNPREAQLLTDSSYQSKLAYAIFSGIVKAQFEKAIKDDGGQEKK